MMSWARAHLAVVLAAVATVVAVVAVMVAVAVASSGGGGARVAPGSIVGDAPLTSGYRLTGTVLARTVDTIELRITRVDASAGEARNVVLRPGARIEFDRPADGTVALARNGRQVSGPDKLQVGDVVTLVGQFTTVDVPPAPPHPGYAFIGVEASAK